MLKSAMRLSLTSNSPLQTKMLGERVAQNYLTLAPNLPVIIKLDGDLGSGKTHFTKGFAKGIGVEEEITSPTYIYLDEYEFKLASNTRKLVHVDAWRIKDNLTAAQLRLEEQYLQNPNVVLIEWGSRYKLDFSKIHIAVHIEIKYLGEYSRRLELESSCQDLLDFN